MPPQLAHSNRTAIVELSQAIVQNKRKKRAQTKRKKRAERECEHARKYGIETLLVWEPGNVKGTNVAMCPQDTTEQP